MKNIPDNERCQQTVFGDHTDHQCLRRGRYIHNGTRYCKQHAPPEIEKREKRQRAEMDRRWELGQLDDKIRSARYKLVDQVIEHTRMFSNAEQSLPRNIYEAARKLLVLKEQRDHLERQRHERQP